MFQKILVDYYGAPTPLQQLASFQNPEARTIIISPFDKGSMHAIEKAIAQADLGLNPSNDGNIIRCVMPQLTEERRKEYIKMARHEAEEARVSVRNVRRHAKDAIEKAVKDGDVGEDEGTRAEKELEGLTKKFVDQIDEVLKTKEAELLEV
jgi:ribosome recycling factor